MKKLNLLVACLVVLGLVLVSFSCAAPKPAPTTPGEVSFEGKTINIVAPFSPGGATDLIARVYSRFLPKFLPGKPIMIVRNMPGGTATIGANYVYLAKPDGLTALVAGGSVPLNQLVGGKAVRYDLLKMPTIAGVAIGCLYITKPGIINQPEDLPKTKGLVFGTGGPGPAYLFICAKEVLNFPVEKVVLAFGGEADAFRAFLAGEVNFIFATGTFYRSSLVPYVEKGEIMLLFQSGLLDEKGDIVKDPGLPPIPTTKELYEKLYGKSPSGMEWNAYKAAVAASRSYTSVLYLPPGTPDNIARVYWAASEAMLKDPEFRKIVDPMVGKEARWGAGEAYDKGFKLNFPIDPKVVDWFRGTLPKYGIVVE